MKGKKVITFRSERGRENVQSYPAQKTKQRDSIICAQRCKNKIKLRNNSPQEKSKADAAS